MIGFLYFKNYRSVWKVTLVKSLLQINRFYLRLHYDKI